MRNFLEPFLRFVFSKAALKLVVALAIPAGITYFWFYSQKQANLEVENYKQEQKDNPTQERVTVDNYELKEIDDSNHLRWQLVAEKGIMQPASKNVELDSVKIEYFDKDKKLKMRLIAPVGTANEGNRYVKLDSKDGKHVIAEGQEGKARLETEKLELTKKNQFVATGGVNIIWPGVAKVTGNSATGSLEKTDLKNLKIVGNTHALIGQ